jgi:hypothetical protein
LLVVGRISVGDLGELGRDGVDGRRPDRVRSLSGRRHHLGPATRAEAHPVLDSLATSLTHRWQGPNLGREPVARGINLFFMVASDQMT